MRRISLAVALMSAVAAAGCSGGAKTSSDAGAAPGVLQGTFSVVVQNGQNGNTALVMKGGKVTSSPAGIDCGVGASGVCEASFALGTSVVLTATPAVANDPDYNLPFQFNGWAGDCQGTSTCTLTGNADKYVVAAFAGKMTVHPNYTDPAVHGPAANNQTLDCASCHGANLDGQGIAVSCKSCHGGITPVGSGLLVNVTSVSVDQATKVVTVNFNLKDSQNKPVDINGVYSTNTVMQPRFALARIDLDANGKTLPYAVLTPATGNPGTITMPAVGAVAGTSGQLVEVGTAAGTYTYTSPALAKMDVAKIANTHTIWLQVTRQTNKANVNDPKGFSVVNKELNFDATTGVAVAAKREITSSASCNKCHNGFKPEGSVATALHSGARVEAPFCNICHAVGTSPGNPTNGPTGSKDSAVFVHMIHAGEHMNLTKLFHNIEVTYPQDPRNCTECHEGAQGDQYKTRPTRAACGACHQTIDFTVVTGGHLGGVQTDDASCSTCHPADTIVAKHAPVIAKDPNNKLDVPTGNSRTNAGDIAAAGILPPLASRITYDVDSVSAVADAGGVLRPTIKFKLKRDGVDVTFNDPTVKTELMDDFVGTTSAYFAFAVPQDGITAPADFNASASGNIKLIWNGTATGTGAGTLAGPDTLGYYTITLTGALVPANAVILTGGIGYTYDLPATQPFTQTNLAAYPFNSTTKSGGLIVPVQNVWKTATGYGARRAIVATDKCNACHGFLGVAPNFHVGQRNDGPTCSFCHNPNRTSSAWSANASTFIHGIHGARKRDVAFNWHSACPTGTTFTQVAGTNTGTCKDAGGLDVPASPWYDNVEYPGSGCTQCHVAGAFDFSAPASAAAVPNLLWSTVGTGTYTAGISTSPYVTVGTNYGSGFSFNVGTGATTVAATTTLVSSPIAAACFSCHDSATAQAHMTSVSAGGKLYQPRGAATLTSTEKCLTCHGANGIAPIAKMH